ncbi:MAG: bifunctional glutamate N-acetyltransferase/amino-acid acetyltransferase ArgJ [Kiritimatiellae bacterium]|nr:bifunctional glutamate N-acetyltransferase/amino-acid acetyltransferase ArgJ [Kiritimatiellia bacterium]
MARSEVKRNGSAPAVVRTSAGGVCSAKGFRAAAAAAGIKYRGRDDVALIVSDAPCRAAALFTTNKVAAAPVIYDRGVVRSGSARVILANSGCANACTGELGLKDARLSALVTAGELGVRPEEVLVASTGVIGRPLPVDRLLAGMKAAAGKLGSTRAHGLAAAKAVMTTDTRPKQACATVVAGGAEVTVGGMAKGSGMIEPNMATMLGFITTDAAVSSAMLKRALRRAVAESFNRLVVDGDESTNDSVFLLANGAAGNREIRAPGGDYEAFFLGLKAVCVSLARQMAADGEGATRFVTVRVTGARTAKDAARAARAVARSPLAKTSWFGGDPNWGRVLAAVGYSGAEVDDMKAEVFYDGETAFSRGATAGPAQLARLAKVMKKKAFTVSVDLHLGDGAAEIYTCDLSTEYVHINADYTT